MKDDLRLAKLALKQLRERGEKEIFIDKCDIDDRDTEILKRRILKKQSNHEVALAMNMSPESAQEHYRDAMITLYMIIQKYRHE